MHSKPGYLQILLGSILAVLFLVMGSENIGQAASPIQTSLSGNVLTVTLTAPHFASDGQGGVKLLDQADLYSSDHAEGEPQLPHRLVKLALPPDADLTSLSMTVTSSTVENVPGAFNIPLSGPKVLGCAPSTTSPGACGGSTILQSLDLSQVNTGKPLFTTLDQNLLISSLQNAFNSGPKSQSTVTLLSPGQLRKWRYVRLDFSPFQYDVSSGSLKVMRSVTVTISFKRSPTNLDPVLLADTVMDQEAQTFLDNYDQAQGDYAAAVQNHVQASASAADYVIITTDDIYNHSDLGQFMHFLRDHGHTVTAVTTSAIQNTPGSCPAEKIRNYLKNVYAAWGIKYVLLVGNPDPVNGDVPMMAMYPDKLTNLNWDPNNLYDYVPTDSYYSNLTGNWDLNGDGFPGEANGDIGPGGVDFTPTVFVGRIPVYNADYGTLNKILQKTMAFEDNPHRQTWQDQALLPMSFWGHNYDAMTLGYLLNNNLLIPNNISAYRLAMNYHPYTYCDQVTSYPYDHDMLYDATAHRWSSNPVGLMVWAGHGNYDRTALGWGDDAHDCWDSLPSMFSNSQAGWLKDSQPAFVFQNSCLNGQPEHADNVGYALLWNGAVTTVSATRNTYLDKTGDSEANLPTNYTSGAGLGYQYVTRLLQGQSASESLGWTRMLASLSPDWNLQNFYDFNVYGDPAAVYRVPPASQAPAAPSNLTGDKTITSDQTQFNLSWQDNSDNEEFFRITLALWDGTVALTQDVGRNTVKAYIPNLPCSTTYYITLQAGNGGLLSGPSNTWAMSTVACIPSAPTGLTAGIVNHKVTLNWSNNPDIKDGFNIYRRVKIGQYYLPPFLAGTVDYATTTFEDDGADCLATNSYTVTAYNATGESDPSASVGIVAPACVPPVPTNLVATPAQTSITFTWTDNSNQTQNQESGFEIMYHVIFPNPGWYTLAILPPDTTSYTWSNLPCGGIAYPFEVVAFNSGGSSTSNVTSSVGTLTCTAPNGPSNLTASPTATSISLAWDDNSDNEYGFKVEQYIGSTWTQIVQLGANDTDTTITGLTCGTSYDLRVKAFNALDSPYDTIYGATTKVCDDYAPTNFQVNVVSASEIDLSWGPPTNIHGKLQSGYQPAYVVTFLRMPQFNIITTLATNRRSYKDMSVSCGHTYRYSVRATYTDSSTSTWLAPVMVKTPVCPPVNLAVATASQTELDVTWQPPSGFAPTGYYLERSPAGQGTWTRVFTASNGELTYPDTNLACGTSYDYRAQSYNGDGSGPYGPTVTGATVVCEPAAPSGLSADHFAQTGLTLHWNDNSSNEDGFRIQRTNSLIFRGGWAEVGTTGADTNSFVDRTLTCGTTVYYRVLAYNAGGDSAVSPALATGPLPCNMALQATPADGGAVSLAWSDPGKNTTLYTLERSPDGAAWSPIGSAPAKATSFVDLTAPCGGTLWYRITASNAQGSTTGSPAAQAVVVCAPTTVLVLKARFIQSTEVHLVWTISSGGGQTNFVISRSPNGQDGFVDIATLPANASSFDDQGLPPWTIFYYRVRAVNTGGSASSNMVRPLYTVNLPLLKK
jgi:hypothetical protein